MPTDTDRASIAAEEKTTARFRLFSNAFLILVAVGAGAVGWTFIAAHQRKEREEAEHAKHMEEMDRKIKWLRAETEAIRNGTTADYEYGKAKSIENANR